MGISRWLCVVIEYGGTLVAPWTSVAGCAGSKRPHTDTPERRTDKGLHGRQSRPTRPSMGKESRRTETHHGRWHTARRKSQHSRSRRSCRGIPQGYIRIPSDFFLAKRTTPQKPQKPYIPTHKNHDHIMGQNKTRKDSPVKPHNDRRGRRTHAQGLTHTVTRVMQGCYMQCKSKYTWRHHINQNHSSSSDGSSTSSSGPSGCVQ